MPKRLGNTQIPSAAGLSDIINLKQHKQYVEQDIFPSPDNDVLSGLRFDGNSYLSRTFGTATSETTKTFSFWLKRDSISTNNIGIFGSGGTNFEESHIEFQNDVLYANERNSTDGIGDLQENSGVKFRDLGSWYHIVVSYDTRSSVTSENRVKLFVNGTQVGTATISPVDDFFVQLFRSGVVGYIADNTVGRTLFSGYLANIHFIDGQALDPSHFGYYNRSSRQWKPKKYSGTYGGNGFYLPFNTNVYRYFNGAASVNLSGSPITTFPCTVSFWVNLNDVGGTYGQVINLNVGGTRASIFYNYDDNGSFTGDQASAFVICIGLQNHFATENLRTYPNSGWHHLAVVFKSGTNVTPDVYIDGEFVSATNRGLSHGGAGVNAIGSNGSSGEYFSGYITNVAYFDNYTITQEEVTEIFNSGLDGDITTLLVTQPNSYLKLNEKTGTTVAATLGTITGTATNSMITNSLDFSGNHNDWTPIGFSGHDTVPDSPQNTFATWNPLAVSTATFSNGNLNATMSSSVPAKITSTFAVSSGKYYMELEFKGNANYPVGISADAIQQDYLGMADGNTSISFWPGNSNTQVYINGVLQSFSGSTTTWASGDIIGIKLDADNEEVSIYKNGNLVGSNVSYSSYGWAKAFFAAGNYINGNQYNINTGQDPTFGGAKSPATTYTDANGIGAFYYQPPDGALALCTANLPRSVIEDPADYFKAVTYTGTYPNANSVNVGFNPDLIWLKSRTQGYHHGVWDTIRTVTGYEFLSTSNTNAEETSATSGDAISFITNGFRVNTGQAYNEAGQGDNNMVAWCWKAGGTPTGGFTGTEAMVDGSQTTCSALATSAGANITPTAMSVNTKAGFSIVKWTGNGAALVDNTYQSIPTGLSGKLAFAIQKRTDATGNWHTYHKNCSVAHTYWSAHLYLNRQYTEQIGSGYDSQVFKYTHSNGLCQFQNGDSNNVSGGEYISYFFEEVEGFSKFGSYTGNGSPDGPFLYCGFRPAFVIIKRTDAAGYGWLLYDNKRSEYNPVNKYLFAADVSFIESYIDPSNNNFIDFLSNGIKLNLGGGVNDSSGTTYIFIAFAEQPFNFTNSR